ncbi:MAG: hypothetical protein V1754_14795 [Pseudomonadota bacterium]
MARKRLGEILLEAGVIDNAQLSAALGEQRRWGRRLGVVLVEMGIVEEETMIKALSRQLNIPAVDLQKQHVDLDAVSKLDFDFCQENACLAFRYEAHGKFLDVAMADPANPTVFDEIRVKTHCNVRPHIAGPITIDIAIRQAYQGKELGPVTPIVLRGYKIDLPPAENANLSTRSRRGSTPAPIRERVIDFDEPKEEPQKDRHKAPTQKVPAQKKASPSSSLPPPVPTDASENNLKTELAQLRAMLERDEMVLRKLMTLLVEKGVLSREELTSRLKED